MAIAMSFPAKVFPSELDIQLDHSGTLLQGDLQVPDEALGCVVFVHGSGSNRHSVRNRRVARLLRAHRIGTLLFDLLSDAEAVEDASSHTHRSDVEWLGDRVRQVTAWLGDRPEVAGLPFGYFGAGDGAAVALHAAAQEAVQGIVTRGGRADLAFDALPQVTAPTLLIVGGDDRELIRLNWLAYERLAGRKRVEVVPRASRLFEEAGKLEEVARLSAAWFVECFEGEIRWNA
jgi:pimeloyl-ACP methyl ester carboxylesterase